MVSKQEVKLVLPGRPVTKKTHNEVWRNKRTGRLKLAPSGQFRRYQEQCLWHIKQNYTGPWRLQKVNLCANYYLPNQRSWPDLVGLLQATCDILEAADVITDDQEVISFDGSGIMGVDKTNPRAEIRLTCYK